MREWADHAEGSHKCRACFEDSAGGFPRVCVETYCYGLQHARIIEGGNRQELICDACGSRAILTPQQVERVARIDG